MLVKFDDKEYNFDLDEISRSEAGYIKRHTGMTLMALQKALDDVDPDALAAIYWLMQKQDGKATDIDRLDFKAVKLANALVAATLEAVEKAQEKGDDPKEKNPKSK